jgi:peptide/nickel transport system substrate-binding protein
MTTTDKPAVGHLSRRSFVARAGATAVAIGLVPMLEACAPAAPQPPAPTPAPAAKPTEAPKPAAPAATTAPAAAPTSAPKPTVAAAPSTAAPAAAGQPVPGGTLRATLGAEPTSVDPHKMNTLFDRDVADALFDALIDDDTLEGVRGALAESWDSPDAKTWTFKLRPGVKFHDGSELTAEVVKANVERAQDPATGAGGQIRPVLSQIASVTAVDRATVRFEVQEPNAAFPVDLADLKIVAKDFDAAKPVGTGPFQFVEWVRNRHVRLKKFPDYFQQGLPYLDELVFLPTPDEDQKIVLLQTGQVEFTDTIPLPRVKEVEQGGKIVVYGIPAGVSPSSYFMLTRSDKPPLDNPKVRQAISLAFDRKALLEVTFDVGTIKSNLVPPKHWAFNPSAPSYDARDLARARQLLGEAGHAGGFSVQLKHLTSRSEYFPMGQLFQANMAEIGIKVELLPLEIGIWVEQVLNKHEFELGLTGIIPAYDPDSIMVRYHPTRSADGKAINWNNQEYVELLARGRATVNQEERKRSYARAQEIAQEASPGFVLNERPILYGASPAVQGFRPDIRQHTHFHTVWLKRSG